MKESLVKMPSAEFSDRIMQQILTRSADVRISIHYLKRAWYLLGIAIIMLPLVFLFTSEIVKRYFTIIHDFLADYFEIIQYTAAIAFVCLVLFILDMLIRQTFETRNSRLLIQ
jgi:hypothetical protein